MNRINISNFIFCAFLISLCWLPNHSYARDEGVNVRKQGAELLPGKTLWVEDNKFFHMEIHDPAYNPSDPWTNHFMNTNVLNKITFGIDESVMDNLTSDFSYTVNFDVVLWRYENGSWTQTTETGLELSVKHTASYGTNLDRDIISFENAHRSIVTINSITDKAGNLVIEANPTIQNIYMENAVEVERFYFFDPYYIPSLTGFLQEKSTDQHLTVYFPFIPEAEWYDLEWTFVDYYSGNTNQDWKYNFEDQATRVRINETEYTLPLVFDEGFILFRYRPVYASPLDGGLPVEGRWTNYSSGGSGLVTSYNTNALHTVSPTASTSSDTESRPHETTMNWQYSAMYTENSRSAHTVSYSDGLDNLRQQVDQLPTNKKTAVSSAIYDYTGRPTVHILPVPMDDAELHYYHGLNQVAVSGGGSEPLHAKHFDDDDTYLDNSGTETECDIDFPGLSVSNSLGAARYYSDQNTDHEGMQAYVPSSQDSYGSDKAYPFSLVQYTPDHTERVKRVTEVGANLTLGSGHETRVYYDVPLPGELQFFFNSNDIGDIKSYRRVITKDPNGQVSYQYLNNFDEVVISSLSPQNPEAYLPVNPGTPPQTISDLLEYATNEEPLSVSLTRFVEKGEEVRYRYFLDPEPYQDACIDATTVCFDCLYDLEIELSFVDECGQTMTISPTGPGSSSMSPMPFDTLVGDTAYYNADCETASDDRYEFPNNTYATDDLSDVIIFPENGYLTITKTLKLKAGAAEAYANLYLDEMEKAKDLGYLNVDCEFKTREEWISDQLNGMAEAIEDCQTYDCEDAFFNEVAPTYMDEYEEYLEDPWSDMDTLDFEEFMKTAYFNMYTEYINGCDSAEYYTLNPCRAWREAMLADFMPGGQYAQYDVNNSGGTVTYTVPDNTSIFHGSPAGTLVNYASVSYDPVTYPIISGVATDPATLTVGEFINNFNPLWAEALLPYHPEYCYIQFCESQPAAFNYEANMLATEDYQEALCNGFFDPQNTGASCSSIPTTIPPLPGGCTAIIDPYISSNLQGYTNALDHPSVGFAGGSSDCIWDAALYIVHGNNAGTPTTFGTDACLEDREWQAFRSLYLMGRKALLDQSFFASYPSC
ncbi:MAG: hypothetical protein ACPF9D_05270, partial [Owenweeksia sp.]